MRSDFCTGITWMKDALKAVCGRLGGITIAQAADRLKDDGSEAK
jgi:hypothetical protein